MRRKQREEVAKPTSKDVNKGAIQRYVLSQSVQHPATIFPFVTGVGSAFYGLLMGVPGAFLVAVGLGFVSVASGVVNFFFRGEGIAKRRMQTLLARRAAYREGLAEELVEECLQEGFEEGAKEARELHSAFQKLKGFLDEQRQSLSAQRFRIMAEDSYQEGVGILHRALNIFKALQRIDVVSIRRDLRSVEKAIAGLAEDCEDKKALMKKRENHQRRLTLVTERQALLAQLITDTDAIETALETSYLELTDLVGDDVEVAFTSGQATSRFEMAVTAARKTEEKLRGLEEGPSDEGDIYLKAGQEEKE